MAMPLLPSGTQSQDVMNAVPDVGRSVGERVGGGVNALLNVGTGDDFTQSPLGQALDRHHQTRVANARRHYDAATTVAAALAQGAVDPQTGEPTGIDPSTQQPMSPEQRQHYKDQLEGAWGDYQKIVGVSPEAKQTLEKHKGILDFAITKGHEALQKVIGAHQDAAKAAGMAKPSAAPAPPPSATGLPNAGSTTPPVAPVPEAASPGGAGGGGGLPAPPSANPPSAPEAPAASPAPAVPAAGALPAPPSPSSQSPTAKRDAELAMPAMRADLAAYQDTKHAVLGGAQGPQAVAQRVKVAATIGLTPGTREYKQFVATGSLPAVSSFQAKQMFDEDSKTLFEGLFDPRSGITLDNNGMQHENARLARPTDGKPTPAPKLKVVNGVPMGVERDGKLITPESKDWSPDDEREFNAAKAAYDTGEASKLKRQEVASSAYARMRGQVQQYSVIDLSTGEPTMANANTINANPGKYGAAGIVQSLKNRAGIFDEIAYTSKQAESAINKLPDAPLDESTRAQLALVLRDPDPHSALSQFLQSNFAASLSPDQIDYVTGLVALQESAMSLRSIAGMGAGSDKLRGAIMAMLPGPGTPSRAYAKRQMELFNGEVRQLRSSVPANEKLGMPSGEGGTKPSAKTPPPRTSGTVKMQAPNGQQKDVPAAQVNHYKSMGATVVQ